MPIKVQIVIHLIQFAPQSIIWAGTKVYIQLTLCRVRLLITWSTYQPTWGRSKMPWWYQWATYFDSNSYYAVRP